MYKEHPYFETPLPEATLWRYIDFTKLVALLDRKALFFVRADKLGDPFEGSFPTANISSTPAGHEHLINEDLRQIRGVLMRLRPFTLISCWHEAEYESEAMWKLYAREQEGVTLKTNFESLSKSFLCEEEIYVGRVKYIDYDIALIQEGNNFLLYLHKRKSFEHGREVRAISSLIQKRHDVYRPPYDVGKYYEIDMSNLIQEVVLAPYSDDWFSNLVQSVITHYDTNIPVRKSVLAATPNW